MNTSTAIDVPGPFAASYAAHGDQARAWLARLPGLGGELIGRWGLRTDGPTRYGMASLVLPVRRADGTPAALKLQELREETVGVATGLRAWDGDGIVRLLDYDEDSGAQLLERVDPSRTLASVQADQDAMHTLAALMARLTSVAAPDGIRRLADISAAMLEQVPNAATAVRDPGEQRLLRTCASAMAELVGEPGDRLLHWDLHYDNVLAGEREPWLAIDPEPLAGDPGFDLWPALDSRWDAVVVTGDPVGAVLRRFDLLTEVIGLDRRRAAGWTLGRVVQNALWDIDDGRTGLEPAQVTVATAMLRRSR